MMVGSAGRAALMTLVLASLTLAGCVAGEDDDEVGPVASDGSEGEVKNQELSPIQVDEATLTGTVVSDDFLPLAGAEVVVQEAEITAITDQDGRYLIEGLPARSYTVFAQADGFGVVRETRDMVGGEVNSMNFILPTLPRQVPHITLVEQSGFIECAYGGAVVTANCIPLQFVFDEVGTNPTNTVTVLHWEFAAPGLQAIVLELAWKSPADGVFSKELQLLAETDSADITEGQTYGSATGPSPVRVELTGDTLPESHDNVTGIFQTRVFPPFEPGNFVFQQKYTVFASFFYHKLPTPGYSGIPDGF